MLLTFDDGPSQHTAAILEVLGDHGLRATFFLVGAHVAERPEIAARIVDGGHAVGNHSWDHPRLTELDDAGIASQLERTSSVIEQATGARPEIFRPPYGDLDDRVERAAGALGMRTQLWDVDPEDWSCPGVAVIAEAIVGAPADAVVLLHDGRGDRTQTVEALRLAVRELSASA